VAILDEATQAQTEISEPGNSYNSTSNVATKTTPGLQAERQQTTVRSERQITASRQETIAAGKAAQSPADISSSVPSAAPPVVEESLTEMKELDTSHSGIDENLRDADLIMKTITGRVVDATTDESLPYAAIALSHTNQLFYTDLEGNFQIPIPESEAVVHVIFTGYMDSVMIVRQGEARKIVRLRTADMIPPLKIIDPARQELKSADSHPAVVAFSRFREHIASYTRFPLANESHSVGRKVTVEFTVNARGRPTAIKITESSNEKSYDDEAIRLIQTGPEWTCPSGKNICSRTYTFYFQ
jgi:TonB family protein